MNYEAHEISEDDVYKGDTMSNRIYLNVEKTGAFIRKAKDLGAMYIQGDDNNEAIFAFPGKYAYDRDDADSFKVAIRLTANREVDIGELKKSCENYQDPTHMMNKSEAKWVAQMLTKLLPHLKD